MKPLFSFFFFTPEDFYRYCGAAFSGDAATQGATFGGGGLPVPDFLCLPLVPILLRCFPRSGDGNAKSDSDGPGDRCGREIPQTQQSQRLARALLAVKESSPNTRIIFSLPYIMRGRARRLTEEYFLPLSRMADGFLLQNIGDRHFLCGLSEREGRSPGLMMGDYALNIMNRRAAAFWKDRLYSAAILPELPFSEQLALAAAYPEGLLPEIVADNRVIVMRSEHCYAAPQTGFHCGRCGPDGSAAGVLTDEKGRRYPLLCNPLDCNCILLSPEPGARRAEQKEVAETRQKRYNEAVRFTERYQRPLLLRYSFYSDFYRTESQKTRGGITDEDKSIGRAGLARF